jgi:hypothetical protein
MSKRRCKRLKAIKLGEAEHEVAFISQEPNSDLIRPPSFRISVDEADVKNLKEEGFCPIHRHPVMANFILALHNILSSELSHCLQSIDIAKAKSCFSQR